MPDMLVRLKKGKTTYEVMVEEGKVTKYRNGEIRNLSEVLASDVVWVQAAKGKRASAEQLSASFGTSDTTAVLEQIVRTGQSQESGSERAQKNADKRTEVIAYIAKHYVDPKTQRAIPLTRVENALTQAKVRIDAVQPADRQAEAIASKLASSGVLTLTRGGAGISATVTCATKCASAASSAMRRHATVTRENFKGGTCTWDVEIHDHAQFVAALNKATKGEFTLSTDNPLDGGSGGGGGGAGPSSSGGGGGKKGKKKRK